MVHQPKEERLAKQRLYYQNHKQQYKENRKKYYQNNKSYFKEYYNTFYNTPKDYDGTLMTYAQKYYETNKEHLNGYQRAYNAKRRALLKLPEPIPAKPKKPKKPYTPKVSSKLIRKRNDIEKQLKEVADKAAAFKASIEN
jgi:hypothetical protein